MMKTGPVVLILSLGITLQACVSKKKFEAEVQGKQKAQTELSKTRTALKEAETRHNTCEAAKAQVEKSLSDLQNRYKILQDNYDADKKAFESSSNMSQQSLQQALSQNEALRRNLEEKQNRLDEAERNLKAREKRVKELEDAIAARDAKAKALRQRLADALLGFQSSDLTVEERNGKVYVSLSQNLLFATGSATLDRKGVDALKKLSEVLNRPGQEDINIMVEGHTDTDGNPRLNWELSTRRSLSIIDELVKNRVEPERLTAAGRGQHAPIADNRTEAGKARNRRTEIVLSPKLDLIYDMIKN